MPTQTKARPLDPVQRRTLFAIFEACHALKEMVEEQAGKTALHQASEALKRELSFARQVKLPRSTCSEMISKVIPDLADHFKKHLPKR